MKLVSFLLRCLIKPKKPTLTNKYMHKPIYRKSNTKRWKGSEVRMMRKGYRLSQAQLAEMLGCRQQTVSEWEKRKRHHFANSERKRGGEELPHCANDPSLVMSMALDRLNRELGEIWQEACALVGNKGAGKGAESLGSNTHFIDVEFQRRIEEIYGCKENTLETAKA